jgi:malate synthase
MEADKKKEKVLLMVNHWREPNEAVMSHFLAQGFRVRNALNSSEARNVINKDVDVVAMELIPEGGYNSAMQLIISLRRQYPTLNIVAWTNAIEVIKPAIDAGANMVMYRDSSGRARVVTA